MKRVFSTTLLVFLLSMGFPMLIYAQSQLQEGAEAIEFDASTKITDVEGLQLELVQNTQDPGSKEIQFDLVIKSEITSDRVQIIWEVNGKSEIVNTEQQVCTLSVAKGETYRVSLTIKPRAFGITDISAKVEAFQIDGTRVASASKTIGSYENGEVFPPTEGHDLAKTLYFARILGTVAVGVLGTVAVGYFAYRRFNRWLSDKNT